MLIVSALREAFLFGLISTLYLLIMMRVVDPRVWGYSDYPDKIKEKIPIQTKEEKRLAIVVGLPWLLFVFGYPIYSTLALKTVLSGEISVEIAFLNFFVLFAFANLGDILLLDWFVISKITPDFVVMEGTKKEDYKDMSSHFIAHKKALLPTLALLLVIALIISLSKDSKVNVQPHASASPPE